MPTPKFICGAECGIVVAGTASAGIEHWASVNGTAPTLVTSGPATMRSARCFRFNPAAATSFLAHTFATAIASGGTLVARFYVYFATLPTASTLLISNPAGGCVVFSAAQQKIFASATGGGAVGATGVLVTTGQWYRIDMKAVFGSTATTDVSVDDVACGQHSVAAVATTCASVTIGAISSTTGDIYIDDIILSGTAIDFPIGVGTVAGLYPNGDKTNSAATPTDGNGGHLYVNTTDFGKGSSGGTAVGAQNVEATSWQSLQKPLSSVIPANFVKDAIGTSTSRLVWTHDAMPAATTVNGVMLVATTHSATATANNQGMQLSDSLGISTAAAWSLLDLSELTITIPIFVFTTSPSGLPWTESQVDACLIRWGLSSDASPTPFLDGVCLEVDYVPFLPHSLFIPPRQATRRTSVW